MKIYLRFCLPFIILALGLIYTTASDGTTKPDQTTLKPIGNGWRPVFNGKDLDGWVVQTNYWKVDAGGVLHGFTPGEPEHHYIYTAKDYDDFELHADVKLVEIIPVSASASHRRALTTCPVTHLNSFGVRWLATRKNKNCNKSRHTRAARI